MTDLQNPDAPSDSEPLVFGWTHGQLAFAGLMLLVALYLFTFQLQDYRSFSSHEAYVVAPAQAMLSTGDYVIPRVAGKPRLKKPPLGYWVVVTSARVFGELNEWTARLPSVLFALLLGGLVFRWGSRQYGRDVGLAAGLVQLTSVYVVTFSRRAEVETLIWLLAAACLYLIAFQPRREKLQHAIVRWLTILILLSIAWQAKFYYAAVMVLMPCAIYWIVERRFRDFFHWINPAGLMIVAFAVCWWPFAVLEKIPDAVQIWQNETWGRALGTAPNAPPQPIWYFIPHVLQATLPWTPFALFAAPRSWLEVWRRGDHQPKGFCWKFVRLFSPTKDSIQGQRIAHERFLWIWFFTGFLIVSLQANKHPHYIYIALPALSLLAGRSLQALRQRYLDGGLRMNGWSWSMLSIAYLGLAAVVWILISHRWPELSNIGITLSALLAVCGPLAAWFLWQRKARMCSAIALTGVAVAFGLAMSYLTPYRDYRVASRDFVRSAREQSGPDEEIVLAQVYFGDAPYLTYYLGSQSIQMTFGEIFERMQQELEEVAENCLPHEIPSTTCRLVTDEKYVGYLQGIGELKILQQVPSPETEEQRCKQLALIFAEFTVRKPAHVITQVANENQRDLK